MTFTDAIAKAMNDQLILIAFPFFILMLVVEYALDKRRNHGLYEKKDMWTSLSMVPITLIVDILPKALAFVAIVWLHEANWLGLRDVIGRQWWAWGLLFFADDLTYYIMHRGNHEVRLLWAGHIPHHSSQYLNYGTALRQGVGERVHKYLFWLWLPIVGFDAIMIFIMISLNLIYQYWTHTELVRRMPKWFEFIFNTASHHRVHHASNPRYLDRNHAGVLIIWDRLFGTFSEEKDFDPPKYGLVRNIESHNPAYVVSHEYAAIWRDVRATKKWSHKLKYIFGPPGWSPDGSRQTSKQIRTTVGGSS